MKDKGLKGITGNIPTHVFVIGSGMSGFLRLLAGHDLDSGNCSDERFEKSTRSYGAALQRLYLPNVLSPLNFDIKLALANSCSGGYDSPAPLTGKSACIRNPLLNPNSCHIGRPNYPDEYARRHRTQRFGR